MRVVTIYFIFQIYPKRESGFVFFGDSTRGHVLSHAFEIQDESARGQRKLYSVIILMKDKMFLLNIEPFLSDYLLVSGLWIYFIDQYRPINKQNPST